MRRRAAPRFQLFLLPALLLVLLDTVLSTRRGRSRRAPAAATAAALALVLLARAAHAARRDAEATPRTSCTRPRTIAEAAAAYQREIQDHADSPRLEYNLGTALLQAGQLEDAVAALERAATTANSEELRYSALYNLGLCYLRQARDAKSSEADCGVCVVARTRTSARSSCGRARSMQSGTTSSRRRRSRSRVEAAAVQQQQQKQQQQQEQQQQPGSLDKRQAEQLLSSAQREERDVQAKKQRENQPERPPAGKDW